MKKPSQGRYYTAQFYRELESAQRSSREILPIIFEALKPSSVVDVGCGTGHWLATARELGVTDVLGIDGPWVRKEQLAIAAESFSAADLTAPLKLARRFDLALSFEVAEHLPESAAQTFIQSLCSAADVIAFSAAIPGQGGRHHLNEQWPAYWAGLFERNGYDCCDYLRPKLWENPQVTWYYAQNSLLFVRAGVPHSFGQSVRPMPLVHPALWSAEIARMRNPGKLFERLVRSVFPTRKSNSNPI